MANNIISEWIEVAMHTPANMQLALHIGKSGFDYAAKLDRLVEAARKVIVEHPNVRSITKVELTAALSEIELESK